MYKVLLLILVLTSQVTDIFGQDNLKWYLSIDKGVTIPVGKFGNKSYTNLRIPGSEINGLAKPGFQFNLSGGYFISPKIAIHSQIGYSINRQSSKSYRDFYSANLPTPFNISVYEKSWKVFKAVLGIKARQSLSKDKAFFIEERILAGISKSKEPGNTVEYVAGSPPQIQGGRYQQSSNNLPATFAWQLGMGIGYDINRRFFLLVDLNYFNSRPQSKFTYVPPPYSSQSPFDSKFEYELNSLGVTGSVGFRF